MREEELLGYQFRQIHLLFKHHMNTLLKSIDLTASQCLVLEVLFRRTDKKTSQKDICEELHLKHTTVNGLLKRMEGKGLLFISPDPENRKCTLVTLLPEAFVIQDKMQKHRFDLDTCVKRNMSGEDIYQLHKILSQVEKNLKESK